MTRIFTDGAEMGDRLFWNTYSANFVVSTTVKRSGAYSYYSGTNANNYAQKNITAVSELYWRFALRVPSSTSTLSYHRLRNGTTIIGVIRPNLSTNVITYYVGGGAVGTGTIPIIYNTWYLIEVYYKVADSGGRFVVKIDGVTDIDYTGDTKPSTQTTIDNVYHSTPTNGHAFYIDDLALNDTSGASDNSWCGDGNIVALVPNGDASVQWTPSTGADNYAMVDEVPADNDTTYVESSTNGHKDYYDLTDFDGAGKTIRRIWVEARARDTVAEADGVKLGVKAGATESLSAAKSLSTSYTRQIGDDLVANPDDSAEWGDADLDALQLVVEAVV